MGDTSWRGYLLGRRLIKVKHVLKLTKIFIQSFSKEVYERLLKMIIVSKSFERNAKNESFANAKSEKYFLKGNT